MTYSIYKITSPSGGFYIGVTRNSVPQRWANHVKRARLRKDNHPLYNAIRKYGAEAFIVEALYVVDDEAEALSLEIKTISETGAVQYGYNISAGGEYDWQTGVLRLAELRKDPAYDAKYRAALSEGIRNSEASQANAANLTRRAAEWRKANPREAWKISDRNRRLAARALGVPRGVQRDHRFAKVSGRLWMDSKKVAYARGALGRSDRTKEQWASLSPHKKEALRASISEATKNHHASKSADEKAAHDAQLAAARKSIDHTKRKARQKEALREYWTPEARAKKAELSRARHRKAVEDFRPGPDWFTYDEAAKILGKPANTVRKHANNGVYPRQTIKGPTTLLAFVRVSHVEAAE